MTKYTLEYLIDTFKDHAKRAVVERKRCIKNYQESNPGHPIPEWMTDEFNLPLAFVSICTEILELKRKNDLD